MEAQEGKNEIEIRSEEVQEIMSHVPNWMIRWGTTMVFVIIAILLFLSWMIKYPDVIKGNATITSETSPSRIVVQHHGIIKKVHVKNGQEVDKGQTLATLESPLDEPSVKLIAELIDTLNKHLNNEELGAFTYPTQLPNFGDLQEAFNQLRTHTNDYFRLKMSSITTDRIDNLSAQIKNHTRLTALFQQQLNLALNEVSNAREKHKSDSILYSKDIISKMDYFKNQSEYASKRQTAQDIKRKIVENQITQTDLKKQLMETQYEQLEQKEQLKQEIQEAMDILKDQMVGWQLNYVLKAPFDGTINLLQRLHENDYIEGGTPLFAVLPQDNKLICYVQISAKGIGKIKTGQRVNIQLANYPAHEFGQVIGEVLSVSEVPQQRNGINEKGYLVKVSLPQGLITTYKKELDLTAEMFGKAEVVTDDARIITRVFNRYKEIFDR